MDLHDLKKKFIRDELGIMEEYGRIFSFVDFSNVNKWFENDNQDWNNKLLADNDKISIDLKKLKSFADAFSERVRIYYGEDPKNAGSLSFTYVMRKIFSKRDVQKIYKKSNTILSRMSKCPQNILQRIMTVKTI